MARTDVKRDSDGKTVYLEKEDAEHADLTANAKRIISVDADGNVKDAFFVKFDPDDSSPTYIGTNNDADASTSSTDWLIFKFTYSGSNITDIVKKAGAWTNRASLF